MLHCELLGYIQFLIDTAFIKKLKISLNWPSFLLKQYPFKSYQIYCNAKYRKLRKKKQNNV